MQTHFRSRFSRYLLDDGDRQEIAVREGRLQSPGLRHSVIQLCTVYFGDTSLQKTTAVRGFA